ncbi:serine-threonine protein kinase 19-domain-containing protein [Haematococcus lacustris]
MSDGQPLQDVEAALWLLNAQFKSYAIGEQLPALVLTSQLRSALQDSSCSLEYELDRLQQTNSVRVFKLSTGVNDYAVLPTSEYVRHIAATAKATHSSTLPAKQQQQQQQQQQQAATVAQVFCQKLPLPLRHQARTPSLTEYQGGQQPAGPLRDLGCLAPDDQVSVLLQLGVLARQPQEDDTYSFSVPGAGPVIKSVLAGRKELKAWLARRQHQEVAEKVLIGSGAPLQPHRGQQVAVPTEERDARWANKRRRVRPAAAFVSSGGFLRNDWRDQCKDVQESGAQVPEQPVCADVGQLSGEARKPGLRLRSSVLGVRFHLHDLLGLGEVVRIRAPSGAIIRRVRSKP